MALTPLVPRSDKRYCYICGSQVERIEFTVNYDEYTGSAVKSEIRKCPKVRFFTLGHPVTEAECYSLQA